MKRKSPEQSRVGKRIKGPGVSLLKAILGALELEPGSQ